MFKKCEPIIDKDMKYLYCIFVFRTSFSGRPMDQNGALIRFEKIGESNTYKATNVVISDFGIRSGYVTVDIPNQKIILEYPASISLQNQIEDYAGLYCCEKVFTANDDASAILIYEMRE